MDTRPKGVLVVAILMAIVGGIVRAGAAHAATPTLTGQASSSGFPVGIQIFDTVTMTGGINPTGTLTFTLFGPDNSTCAGTPVFTSSAVVDGNGYYQSGLYVTTAAGSYRWSAVYGGDAGNAASAPTPCTAPSAQVTVGKRTLQLGVVPTWAPPAATVTARLSGGAGPSGPTGTITYKLFGPGNTTCAGISLFVATRSVNGNGSYTSASFLPVLAGTYRWTVVYSGDVNNNGAGTVCSEGFNAILGATVSATPSVVARGGTVTVTWAGVAAPKPTDWVALYPTGAPDGGSVIAWKYATGAAAGAVALKFAYTTLAGTYEARLMANNTIVRLATSEPITLMG